MTIISNFVNIKINIPKTKEEVSLTNLTLKNLQLDSF